MNKSFLGLLRREEKILAEIRNANDAIENFSHVDCKTKNDKKILDNVISHEQDRKEKAEENLLEVRKEIKEYFSFIMEL